MLRARVRRLVDGTGPTGRLFDLFFQALIVASMIAFVVETEPDLGPDVRAAFRIFEVATVVAFTLEYLLRLWAAPRALGFVFSFWGIVDLVAILPFFLGTAVDLRSIRILRLLRLVRLLKLARYTSAVARFRRAFVSMRAELTLFLVTSGILIYIVSVGIYYCEREAQPDVFGSIGACIWWSIVTLTTVGYGDAYPITAGGRIFTTVVLVIGLGVVAIPSGMVASALTRAAELGEDDGP
ncbi:MAG: ion transporter [Parvibaculum sp.]